jgi:hypothetical protein
MFYTSIIDRFGSHALVSSLEKERLYYKQTSGPFVPKPTMIGLILQFFAATVLLSYTVLAATPIVASTTNYGSLVNVGLNRDSCSSSLWSNNVVRKFPPCVPRICRHSYRYRPCIQLWVCRDTQPISDGQPVFPIVANTASFSSFPSDRSNPQPLVLSSPQGFGSLYYPLEADECPPFGVCSDGTRWVGWPDTGPVVTFRGANGSANGYAFITRTHLSGLSAINTPSFSLYHVISQSAGPIPATNIEISNFWTSTQIGYGSAASVVNNGFVSLELQTAAVND